MAKEARRQVRGTLRVTVRLAAGLVAAIVVTSWWVATRDLPEAPEVDAAVRIEQPVTTTSSTVLPPTTTSTALAADQVDVTELPGGATRVVSRADGIVLATEDGSQPLRRLTWEPTLLAFGVGAGRVVAQHEGDALGRIVVYDARAAHEVYPGSSAHDAVHRRLLDAGWADGRPTAVIVETVDRSGGGEQPDSEAHLLLLDLDTLERTDLGVVAGWEAYVVDAALLSDGSVVLVHQGTGATDLQRIRHDGSVAWQIPLDDDLNHSVARLAAGDGRPRSSVLVVSTAYTDGQPLEVLGVSEVDPWAGAVTDRRDLHLDPPPTVEEHDGLCGQAEADSGALLCDRLGSAPVRIDRSTGRTSTEPGATPAGTTTVWRSEGT